MSRQEWLLLYSSCPLAANGRHGRVELVPQDERQVEATPCSCVHACREARCLPPASEP